MFRKRSIYFWTISLFIFSPLFSSQNNSFYFINHLGGNTKTPFWMQANRWGAPKGSRINLIFDYNFPKFKYLRFKGDILSTGSNVQIIEGNFSLAVKNYQIRIGKIKYLHGIADHDLSSGSLIQSKNAEPIPKILLENSDPFIFNINKIKLFINFGLTHGLIEKGVYLSQPQLHEKWVNLKIKKNDLSLHFGLVHNAIFGGETHEFGQLPGNLADFFRVFFVQNGDENAPINEKINALGNHLGIWDIGFSLNRKNYIFYAYHQHPFEDESGARWLLNLKDGLYGITIEDKLNRLFIDKINIEFIYTLNQSGSKEVSENTYGWDDYYNHYVYLSGWTNKGRSIGTPFVVLGSNDARKYIHIENNRIKVIHLGISGKVHSKISYKFLNSYSVNYGNYFDEDRLNILQLKNKYSSPINQYSGMFEIYFNNLVKNNNLSFGIVFAQDIGDLYADNSSFEISFKYQIR